MDASMISMLSMGITAPTTSPGDGSPSSGSDPTLGGWGWGFGDFDHDLSDIPPAKTYADDAAGRRERLDDLGTEIAAARARLGDLR